MSLEPTLDHLGPIARNVTDCAKLLQAIAGYDDGRDHRQHPSLTVPNYQEKLRSSCSGIKIGAITEGFDFCTAEVKSAVRSALNLLSDNGVQVDDVSIPMHKLGDPLLFAVCAEGGYHTRNGVGAGHRGYYNTSLNDHMSRAVRTNMSSAPHPIKFLYLLATHVRKHYPGHYYCKAQNLMLKQRADYDEMLEKYDVLVMPTIPTPAKRMPLQNELSAAGYLEAAIENIGPNTGPFDNSGHPALTINCGYVKPQTDVGSGGAGDGRLPIGMMIVGRHYDEQTVLNVARAYERLRDANTNV